jgi:hypothetical protein
MAMVEVVLKKAIGIKVRLGQQPCFFFIIERGWKKSNVDHSSTS